VSLTAKSTAILPAVDVTRFHCLVGLRRTADALVPDRVKQYDVEVNAELAELENAILLGRSLANAYKANPLVQWMFEDDLSEKRLRGLFTSLVEFGIKNGLVYQTAHGDGAAIWFPPVPKTSDVLDLTTDTSDWSGGRRDAALAVLAAERPTEPHYYLDAVGVVPNARRQGKASGLLAPVLEKCAAEGVGAYLENSDPANESFYSRQGFEVTGQLPMPQGAPVVVAMWRQPRSDR
jgi:GNAT superfamily N-acetyltransferase